MNQDRFDWWRALAQVVGSIEAVRDWRAMYVLLMSFAGAGLAMGMTRSSLNQGLTNWAIGQGALALFIAFYGSQAAGLLLMDRTMGRPAREVADAVHDSLGVSHRVLIALMVMVLAGGVLGAAIAGVFWICGLPVIGPWLYAFALPATVLVLGGMLLAGGAVVGPLTGPIVWAGATSRQAVWQLIHFLRGHLLHAVAMMAGLSAVTALVGAGVSLVVLIAGRVMAELSSLILGVTVPPEILMAGLLGHTVYAVDLRVVSKDALPYISAANVGGGVVFGLALVMPTLVYLRGVCEIYVLLLKRAATQSSRGLRRVAGESA